MAGGALGLASASASGLDLTNVRPQVTFLRKFLKDIQILVLNPFNNLRYQAQQIFEVVLQLQLKKQQH